MVKAKSSKRSTRMNSSRSKKTYKNWLTYKGKLEGPGYLSRDQEDRKKILKACIYRHGYRSCLGSLTALKRNKKTSDKYGSQLASNTAYLERNYGGKGSYGPRNPYRKDCSLVKKKSNSKSQSRNKSLSRSKSYRIMKTK